MDPKSYCKFPTYENVILRRCVKGSRIPSTKKNINHFVFDCRNNGNIQMISEISAIYLLISKTYLSYKMEGTFVQTQA